VEVVADDPDWVIRVTAEEMRNVSGQRTGVAFAIVYLESFRQLEPDLANTDACLNAIQRRSLREMFDHGFRVRDTSIHLGSQQTAAYAHEIAMYFNAQFLEPHVQ
jgi:hypothetical protein